METKTKVRKEFKVVAKSSNTNSFGLYQFVVVAPDGEAYKLHGSMYVGKDKGDLVVKEGGVFRGFEMPEKMEKCPEPVLREIFNL